MRRLNSIIDVDRRGRCTLPGVAPGELYRIETFPNGVLVLTPVEIAPLCLVCSGRGQLGTGIGQECGACEGSGYGRD